MRMGSVGGAGCPPFRRRERPCHRTRILLLVLPSDRRVASPAVVEAHNVVEDGGVRHGFDCRRASVSASHPHTAINAMKTSGCC